MSIRMYACLDVCVKRKCLWPTVENSRLTLSLNFQPKFFPKTFPTELHVGVCMYASPPLIAHKKVSVSLCCRIFRQWATRGVSRRRFFSSLPPSKARLVWGLIHTELGQMEKHHIFVFFFQMVMGRVLRSGWKFFIDEVRGNICF
jgi:hypothetical protein